MPIYEYRCENCGHELERLQRMSDAALTDCPACEQARLKRLISAAGFRLKGSGWYETDFKKDNRRNVADSGSDSKPSGGSDSDAKPSGGTDNKTATAKTESKPAAKKAESGTSA